MTALLNEIGLLMNEIEATTVRGANRARNLQFCS